jgi:hypothetical protein
MPVRQPALLGLRNPRPRAARRIDEMIPSAGEGSLPDVFKRVVAGELSLRLARNLAQDP